LRRQGLIPQPGVVTAFGVQTERGRTREQVPDSSASHHVLIVQRSWYNHRLHEADSN
jgi:hypothetical protein